MVWLVASGRDALWEIWPSSGVYMMCKVKWKPNYLLFLKKEIGIGGQLDMRSGRNTKQFALGGNRGEW